MRYDVAIVGAGPAGCAAALVLRQAGLQVCLIDAVKETPFKVGESLPGAAVRLLHKLGIASIASLLKPTDYRPCHANVSAWGDDRWVYTDAVFNPEGGGWHLNRPNFDTALREKALERGAELYHGKVESIVTASSPVTHHLQCRLEQSALPHSIEASWLIDATGRAGWVSKKMGAKRTRTDQQMAVIGWLRTEKEDLQQTTTLKSVPDGWWYTNRLPGAMRVVALHGLPSTIAQMVKNPWSFVAACNRTGLLPGGVKIENLLTHLRATDASVSRPDRVGGQGWLAVGDAALSFDPLSSQGIFFALYSGIRGAETILACAEKPDNTAAALANYANIVQKVCAANVRARIHYYSAEQRYINNPYWQHIQSATKEFLKTTCLQNQ